MKLTQGTGMGTCWWINIIMFFSYISRLRKSRVFVKSRYSRNRQWCRSIVVLTLFINLLVVMSVLAIFYKLKIKYSALGTLLTVFAAVYGMKSVLYVGYKCRTFLARL